jgi:response regulator NasT
MDLIIVADSLESTQPLLQAAGEAGFRIMKFVGPNDEVAPYVRSVPVDAVIFVCDEVERDELREMQSISKTCPKPVLVLTRDARRESMAAAVKAGASAYVVDCHELDRLPSLLEVALTRFSVQREMQDELDYVRNALTQRKMIERAKGIIMKQRNLDEDDAYRAMRKLAMDHNKKLAEVAGQIITASELLC